MLIPNSTTFEVLLNYFTFFGWLGYGVSISSILWLRYKRPDAARPYKVTTPGKHIIFPSNDHCRSKTKTKRDFARFPALILKPGFHMSGKSQTIGDFVVSRLSQTFPTQGDNGRHLPRRVFISRECLGHGREMTKSPMVWDFPDK